jgi:serine/threonine protein kinase
MAQRNPRLIGGVYRTNQVVTSGGILTNYTADNHNTNEMVGLVVLEFPSPTDAQTVQKFFQPMERRRSVQSPYVIHVYDWGVDGNRAYIATDPPRGLSLRYIMDNEFVDLRRALDFSQQMTRGVIALHGQDIVGLDLRPQLITVDSTEAERVQLDDVGLRSLLKMLGYVDSQRVDDIGYLDPRYAPPEYIQGGQIGPWSDIYQLGLLLFELVTGRLPFVGRDSAETAILQCSSPVPRLAQYKNDASQALQGIVDRALVKAPEERFMHAGALLNALESLQPPVRRSGGLRTDSGILLRPQRPAPTVYANLCYEQDGEEMQRLVVTKPEVIIGRSDPRRGLHPDIDLSALDTKMTVSRQHARISYKNTSFYIEDLKSHNKTHLGEEMLVPNKPELLQDGNVVYFGAVRLVFRVPRSDKPGSI